MTLKKNNKKAFTLWLNVPKVSAYKYNKDFIKLRSNGSKMTAYICYTTINTEGVVLL